MTEEQWVETKAAYGPGSIIDTGGVRLMVEAHDDFVQEFYGRPVKVSGMRARNLETLQEINLPAQFWTSFHANVKLTQAANKPTPSDNGRSLQEITG